MALSEGEGGVCIGRIRRRGAYGNCQECGNLGGVCQLGGCGVVMASSMPYKVIHCLFRCRAPYCDMVLSAIHGHSGWTVSILGHTAAAGVHTAINSTSFMALLRHTIKSRDASPPHDISSRPAVCAIHTLGSGEGFPYWIRSQRFLSSATVSQPPIILGQPPYS